MRFWCVATLFVLAQADNFQQFVNALSSLATGDPEFDPQWQQEFHDCVASYKSELPGAVNGIIQGMFNYSRSHGAVNDTWKPTIGQPCTDPRYMEKNLSTIQSLNMSFCEPCNTFSNLAYLRAATRFCRRDKEKLWKMNDDSKRAFLAAIAMQALGSLFMHGSETGVGEAADCRGQALVFFVTYQNMIAKFPAEFRNNPILRDVSLTPQPSGLEAVAALQHAYGKLPVEEWNDYYLSMGPLPSDVSKPVVALALVCLTMVFPPGVVDEVAKVLFEVFAHAPGVDSLMTFMQKHYLPTLRNATKHVKIGYFQRISFASKALGSWMPLVYGVLFQEEILQSKIWQGPEVNKAGSKLMPWVYKLADTMTGYKNTDSHVKNADSQVYPGADWCRDKIPHAKWHEATANGYIAFAELTEYIAGLVSADEDVLLSARSLETECQNSAQVTCLLGISQDLSVASASHWPWWIATTAVVLAGAGMLILLTARARHQHARERLLM